MKAIVLAIGALLVWGHNSSTIAQSSGQEAVETIFGAIGNVMQHAIEQQRLEQLRNTPEYRDQEIQPGGLTRGQVIIVQQLLSERGHDVGAPDGIIGPKTRAVVARLQAQAGVPITGYPTQDLLEALARPQ